MPVLVGFDCFVLPPVACHVPHPSGYARALALPEDCVPGHRPERQQFHQVGPSDARRTSEFVLLFLLSYPRAVFIIFRPLCITFRFSGPCLALRFNALYLFPSLQCLHLNDFCFFPLPFKDFLLLLSACSSP